MRSAIVYLAAAAVFGLAISLPIAWTFSQLHFSSETPPQQRSTINQTDEAAKGGTNQIADTEKADDRIARYTLWLAIFSGLLVVVSALQIYFLTRTDKTARISADAAKLSAEATNASVKLAQEAAAKERSIIGGGGYRPFVEVEGTTGQKGWRATKKFHIHVTNHGRGPATIEKIRWGFCEIDGFPKGDPPYSDAPTDEPVGAMTLSGKLAKEVDFPDTWKKPVIFIRFEYRDLFLGQTGSYGFVMQILPDTPLPIQFMDAPEPYIRKALG